jgi:hypothetical protein
MVIELKSILSDMEIQNSLQMPHRGRVEVHPRSILASFQPSLEMAALFTGAIGPNNTTQ